MMIIVLAVCQFVHAWIAVAQSDIGIVGSRLTSGEPFGSTWTLNNLYDGHNGVGGNENNCFCTRRSGGVAELDIELSDVTQMTFWNRDFMPQRMTGIQIEVCHGDQCKSCGPDTGVPDTGASTSVVVTCQDGGITGNKIVLKPAASHALTFCEIIVAGKTIDLSALPTVQILGSRLTSGEPFNAAWTLDNLYDGQKGKGGNDNNCFCTRAPGGVAELDIELSDVTQMTFWNRDFMPVRMTGIQIDVCEGGQCKPCGTVPGSGPSLSSLVTCADGPITGNKIVLKPAESTELSFCEIIVYGTKSQAKPDCVCTDYHRFCPALNDDTFVERYKGMVERGVFDLLGSKIAEPPTPIDCETNEVYQVLCPKSCGKCSC